MNRFMIVLTNRRNIIISLLAIFFIIGSAFIIADLNFPKVAETKDSAAKTVLTPQNENYQLKDILSSIVPAGNSVLYENNRNIEEKYDISDESNNYSDIIKKGKDVPYIFVYSNDDYLRPIYSSTWKQTYYQGWLYLPRKIVSARHCLFTYTGGAGKIFDIEGELGFYPNISIDNQNYVNFMVYNIDLQNVYQSGNKLVITGIPVKKGVHVISIKIDDINAEADGSEFVSVHLCTPAGYEIDYQDVHFSKFSNKEIDENFSDNDEELNQSYVQDSVKNTEKTADPEEIKSENLQLNQELLHYVSDASNPIYFQHSGSYQTANALNKSIDLEEALKYSKKIDYKLLYNNEKYVSPVFHPMWKENYDKEWCYIPRKMYLNMKKLFVLPSDKDVAGDLCGELGFFEKYKYPEKNHTGLLINRFSVSAVSVYEDNVLIEGIPSRNGIQIISIPEKNLTEYPEYAVRLVTKDQCELDVDVIKHQ